MIARPATPGLWVDTAAHLTILQAKALIAEHSPVGIVRTLPLPGLAHEISHDELAMLTALGLEVMLYQRVRNPGWDPRSHSGAVDAAVAVQQALDAGYPDGHIYLDLEGIHGDAAGTITFANAWASRITMGGFLAGCYVGYDTWLTPEQLYELHTINSYGSDIGMRHVATRDCAWRQTRENVRVDGVPFDFGKIQPDLLGEVPFACCTDSGFA